MVFESGPEKISHYQKYRCIVSTADPIRVGMAPPDRSLDRNIRFSDERNPDAILGGLVQNGSVTEMNFLSMLNIVLISTSPIRVFSKATGAPVLQTDTPLGLGDYIVSCDGKSTSMLGWGF